MHGGARDVKSGALMIASAVAGLVVMANHPTGHELMDPATQDRLMLVNVMVHGLAIASTMTLFLSLLGLNRCLGTSDTTVAALVASGFASVAVMCAALASGFVAPGVITHIVAKDSSTVPQAFLLYTSLWNQAFAKTHTVAASVGIVLWSSAMLKTGRVPAGIAWYGIVAGVGIAIPVLIGVLPLNVHGFGLVIITQGAWYVLVGSAMLRRTDPTPPRP